MAKDNMSKDTDEEIIVPVTAGCCIRGPRPRRIACGDRNCETPKRTAMKRQDHDRSDDNRAGRRRNLIHPGWVRICHWINAVAILVMIGSGWQIFNASPLFDFTFSRTITLGRWLGGAIHVALRGNVGAGDKRSRLSDARHRHRPLSPQAAADLSRAR